MVLNNLPLIATDTTSKHYANDYVIASSICKLTYDVTWRLVLAAFIGKELATLKGDRNPHRLPAVMVAGVSLNTVLLTFFTGTVLWRVGCC